MLQRRALPSGKTGRIDPSWSHLVWTASMTSQQCRPVDRPAATYLDARRLLPTTSTGDDDVALEVKNAANRNLIHAASELRIDGTSPFHIVTRGAEARKGTPRPLAGPFGGLLPSRHDPFPSLCRSPRAPATPGGLRHRRAGARPRTRPDPLHANRQMPPGNLRHCFARPEYRAADQRPSLGGFGRLGAGYAQDRVRVGSA